MKRIITLITVLVLIFALSVGAEAVMSADQVLAGSDRRDLAKFGSNDPENTDLGDIYEEAFILWGWYSTDVEGGIVEFGYRYGDAVFLGSPKFRYGEGAGENEKRDDEAVAAICGGKGESVRFRIEVPVVKGEDIEAVGVVKLADGSVVDMWRVVYSAEEGIDMPSREPVTSAETKAETTAAATETEKETQTEAEPAPPETDAETEGREKEKISGDTVIIIVTVCVVIAVFAVLAVLAVIKKKK
ncbi:MAG: hypothetical protein J5879_10075 [Clostridia bacterium]|nr:hypothetical protein [Clostridia bacterium]